MSKVYVCDIDLKGKVKREWPVVRDGVHLCDIDWGGMTERDFTTSFQPESPLLERLRSFPLPVESS